MQIKAVDTQLVSENLTRYTDFLLLHLGRFRDDASSIKKSFQYILRDSGGGHVFEANTNDQLVGLAVVLNTHMEGFLPEKFLVYIAVPNEQRGKGIGREMIRFIQQYVGCEICLHVEKDNPAKKLYERCGFTNKYDEMRYYPHGHS